MYNWLIRKHAVLSWVEHFYYEKSNRLKTCFLLPKGPRTEFGDREVPSRPAGYLLYESGKTTTACHKKSLLMFRSRLLLPSWGPLNCRKTILQECRIRSANRSCSSKTKAGHFFHDVYKWGLVSICLCEFTKLQILGGRKRICNR